MSEEHKALFKSIIEDWIPIHQTYGVKLLEVDEGYVKLLFPFNEGVIGDPRVKRLHGGFIATAVDSSGGAAAMTQMTSDKDDVSTADMRVDYLRPGKAQDIIAEGRITHKTSRTIFTEMRVYHTDYDSPIALGRGVFTIKHR